MKKFKSLLAGIIATAMLMTTITGCTKAPDSDKPSDSKNESQVGGTESTLSGEVVYWSMWQETEPQAEILKKAIEDFKAANKNVKVTVEWTGRTIKDLITPALTSKQKVDIFDTDPMNLYKADTSLLMNLDDFYTSKAIDSDKTLQDSILGGLIEWDKALGAEKGITGTHSVPYAPYVVSWFYNKSLFEQAGIQSPPTTWEEFDAACAKLLEKGIVPITTDDAYLSMIYSYYLERAIGEDNIKKLANESGTLWDDPMILQMLKAMEDFAKKGYFSKEIKTNKYPAGQMEFAQAGAAMYLNASWFPAEIKEATGDDFKWGQFSYPTVPGGSGKLTENTIGGQAFMINAATENKEAAYELLKHFVSDKTQALFLENNLVPCTTATDWPATVSEQKAIVNELTKNINWNASMNNEFIDGVVNAEITKVITGSSTAEQCLAEIKKQAESFKK